MGQVRGLIMLKVQDQEDKDRKQWIWVDPKNVEALWGKDRHYDLKTDVGRSCKQNMTDTLLLQDAG